MAEQMLSQTGGCMNAGEHQFAARRIRRAVEYALAIGIALLCSYWIVLGRW